MNGQKKGDPEMIAQNLIAGYESVLGLSYRMLALARQGEWPELIEEQSRYVMAMDHLASIDDGTELHGVAQERRATLVETILQQNLEIQEHLIRRRDDLQRLIDMAEHHRVESSADAFRGDAPAPP
ncbi:MAG: flagellar protein FliT [Pseudomonas sp.]